MGCFSVIAEFFRRERLRAMEEERIRRLMYGDNNRARATQQQRSRQRAAYPQALPCDDPLPIFSGENGRGTVTGDVIVSDPALLESLWEFLHPVCKCQVPDDSDDASGKPNPVIGSGCGIIALMGEALQQHYSVPATTESTVDENQEGSVTCRSNGANNNMNYYYRLGSNQLSGSAAGKSRKVMRYLRPGSSSSDARSSNKHFLCYNRIPDECMYTSAEYITI